MRVLEYPQLAALTHKFLDLTQYGFADLLWQGNERQTANDISHLAQTRFRVYLVRLGGIAANDVHVGIVLVKRGDQIVIEFEAQV